MSIQAWLMLSIAFDKINVKIKYTDLNATRAGKFSAKKTIPELMSQP